MASSSEGLHEQPDQLRVETIDRHRAIVSLMEELEAVDWYNQRVDAATDPELVEILGHNRDEESEHAAMVLEWLRRRYPALDKNLRTYLFTSGDILGIEDSAADRAEAPGAPGAEPAPADGSLGIGSLKGTGE